MRGHVFAIIGAIGVTLAFLYLFGGFAGIAPPVALLSPHPHVYDNLTEPITEISITAVYFVPRGMSPVSSEQWMMPLERELTRLQEFHSVQFRGSSRIRYFLHPTPIIGEKPRNAYDVDTLRHNDPEILRPVINEAASAVGHSLDAGPPYQVLLVLYEGAGAGGAKHAALLSRSFFERADTRPDAGTFLAHEFYHALGIPDAYQTVPKVFPDGTVADAELVQTRDVMGRVRLPLEEAYLEPETLTAMGL
mgnify:CR=1 FL=1